MKRPIFPSEISEFSYEALFVKHSLRSNIIYIILILAFLSTLICLPLVKVSISKQGRGIITSPTPNNEIFSPKYGAVTSLNIKENQKVNKGDKILAIDTYELDEKENYLNQEIVNLENKIIDLDVLIQGTHKMPEFRSAKYLQEWIQHYEILKDLTLKENHAKRNLKVSKQLYDADVIALNDFKEVEFKSDLAGQAISTLLEKQKNIWQSEKYQISQNLRELNSQKQEILIQKLKYTIHSPIDGVITNFNGVQVGNIISPNQKIAEIVPMDSLIVECAISSSDIGYIKNGTPVKFQVDAYNYNLWGLATGTVLDISKDIVLVENMPFFKVWCSIDQDHLKLKNGYEGELSRGFSLKARFFIAERTLFQLLYDKIDDWLNPKIN